MIAGEYVYSTHERFARFVPSVPLPDNTVITVTLSDKILSTNGVGLDPTEFEFTTVSSPDDSGDGDGDDGAGNGDGNDGDDDDDSGDNGTDPPPMSTEMTFEPLNPRPWAGAVDAQSAIEIRFSAPVEVSSLDDDAFKVYGSVSGSVSVALSSSGETTTTVTLTPTRPFTPGELVTVSLARSIEPAALGTVFFGGAFTFRTTSVLPSEEAPESKTLTAMGQVIALTSADLDADGIVEIVVQTASSPQLDIYRISEHGEIVHVKTVETGSTVHSFGVADLDFDGSFELVVGLADRVVVLQQSAEDNVEAFTFSTQASQPTHCPVLEVTIADLDHESQLDVVIQTGDGLMVFLDGLNTTASFNYGDALLAATETVVGDFDLDGRLELLYGNSLESGLSLHAPSPEVDGTFLDPVTIPTVGTVRSIAPVDLTGDDVLDLVVLVNEGGSSVLVLYSLNADGHFTPVIGMSLPLSATATGLTVGDRDADGVPEMIVSLENGKVISITPAVFLNPGLPVDEILSLPSASATLLSDLTGDGVLDLAVVSGTQVVFLLSEVETPPANEDTFRYSVDSLTVRLGDADNSTVVRVTNPLPVVGLSYVLTFDRRVVTNPEVTTAGTKAESAEFSSWQRHEAESAVSFQCLFDFLPPFVNATLPPGVDQEISRLHFDAPENAPFGESPLRFTDIEGERTVRSVLIVAGENLRPELDHGVINVVPGDQTPVAHLSVSAAPAAPGETLRVAFEASTTEVIEAFTFVVSYDTNVLELMDLTLEGSTVEPLAPELIIPTLRPEDGYFAYSILIDFVPPFDTGGLPPGPDHVLFFAEFLVSPTAEEGETPIEFNGGIGEPPITNIVVIRGQTFFPFLTDGVVSVEIPSDGPTFVRGDADSTRAVNVSDAIATVNWLIKPQSPPPPCLDAADFTDNGEVDLLDASNLLQYLFAVGAPPSVPFPDPGVDPTSDELDCSLSPW